MKQTPPALKKRNHVENRKASVCWLEFKTMMCIRMKIYTPSKFDICASPTAMNIKAAYKDMALRLRTHALSGLRLTTSFIWLCHFVSRSLSLKDVHPRNGNTHVMATPTRSSRHSQIPPPFPYFP